MAEEKKPPFRANPVGSLLRPPELMQAREKRQKGEISAAELREVEDRCIRGAVKMQEEIGIQGVSDGEFRRNLWHADFLGQFQGIKVVEGLLPESARHFQNPDADVQRSPTRFVVTGKLGHPGVNALKVDGYFLEFDTPRAGNFAPLRYLPKGKKLILGLVTSKSGALEDFADLTRRITRRANWCRWTSSASAPSAVFPAPCSATADRRRSDRQAQACRPSGQGRLGRVRLSVSASPTRFVFRNSAAVQSSAIRIIAGKKMARQAPERRSVMASSYRADNIGSLLRPRELLDARAAYRERKLAGERLREIEDRSILQVLELQKAAGVEVFTDGEYRRDIFTADITQAVDGLVPGKITVSFEWRGAGSELAKESKEGNLQFIVGGKLRKKGRLTPGEAPFLKRHAPGPFKVCTPAATQHALTRYRPGVTDKVYPTIYDMLQDVAAIMRHEVQALVDEGVSYVQLDAPSYATFYDSRRRESLKQSGVDPDEAFDAALAADNAMIEGIKRGSGVVTGMHFCRGNKRSAWGAEGSYEPIAEKAFGSLKVDRYLFEFDSGRAGGFEPLRFVPKGKTVVLGLITTKEPRLESEDELLLRIEEASKYVAIENLAVSTQCGFASAASGNLLSWEDMRRKLELVSKVARRVWR